MVIEELRQKRKDCGLTQRALAECVGISRSMIACYETGKRKPSYDIMKRIAVALNETIEIR